MAIAAAALCACSLFAAEEEDGGQLEIWPKDHGRFLFVNAQSAVKKELLEAPVSVISSEFSFDVKLVEGTAPDARAAQAELKKLGAKGAMWIVNDPALPISLCACEDGWAFLNVASFADDKEKLARRCEKLVFRTLANIHGIGDSQMMPQCVMKTAVGLAGIDELVCREYSPEAIMKVGDDYEKMKPVFEKLNAIKWKGQREKFKTEHESERRQFYAVRRKLKEHSSHDGKYPKAAWRKELERIQTEREEEYQRYVILRNDLKTLWSSRQRVDGAIRQKTREEMERPAETR